MKKMMLVLGSILFLVGCSVSMDEEHTLRIDAYYEQQAKLQSKVVMQHEDPMKPPNDYFANQIEQLRTTDFSTVKLDDAQVISYMAFGDSLTRGIGDERLLYGYTERLVAALEKWPAILQVELDNRGKNGRRSDQLLALFEKGHYNNELPHANLITMTLGGNDVMKVVKEDLFGLQKKQFDAELVLFVERYKRIVAHIRSANEHAPLILIGFYNPFSVVTDETTVFEQIIDEWNAEIEQIAAATPNACYVPIEDIFATGDTALYHTDFFHPNANGYEQMTSRIIETLQSCDLVTMSNGQLGFEVLQHE